MSLTVRSITFNPFEENTYLISSPSRNSILIDPGCFTPSNVPFDPPELRLPDPYPRSSAQQPWGIFKGSSHVPILMLSFGR